MVAKDKVYETVAFTRMFQNLNSVFPRVQPPPLHSFFVFIFTSGLKKLVSNKYMV